MTDTDHRLFASWRFPYGWLVLLVAAALIPLSFAFTDSLVVQFGALVLFLAVGAWVYKRRG